MMDFLVQIASYVRGSTNSTLTVNWTPRSMNVTARVQSNAVLHEPQPGDYGCSVFLTG